MTVDLDLRHFRRRRSSVGIAAEPKPGPGVAHTMSLEQPFIESKPEEPDAGAIASS
jgi:hypothetical protein